MTAEIIPFNRYGDAIKRETIICACCESRAMRIITDDAEKGWAVECHNCGELFEDIQVTWETSGTPS